MDTLDRILIGGGLFVLASFFALAFASIYWTHVERMAEIQTGHCLSGASK